MPALPVVREEFVEGGFAVLLFLLFDLLGKGEADQDAQDLLLCDLIEPKLIERIPDRLYDHLLGGENRNIGDAELVQLLQIIDASGENHIDFFVLPELLCEVGDMSVIVVPLRIEIGLMLLWEVLRKPHEVIGLRQKIAEDPIHAYLRVRDLKIQENREHINGLIGGKGTGDTDIRKLMPDIMIAELSGEEHHIAFSAAVVIDFVDICHLLIDVAMKTASKVLLLYDLVHGLQGMVRAHNGNIYHGFSSA